MAAFDFPSNPNVNDIYTLNGVAFMWNGSVWKRYSTSTGAQGFQGAAGAAGAQGAQGTAGVLGGDGAQGAVGAQGAAGNAGSTGAQGAAGATGAQGAAGAAGAQGAPFDRSEYNYTASNGQTAFAAAYANSSDVDVFMNGVRLTPAEYTASGGTTITLASGATAGDIIDILTFASAGPTGAQGAQGHQGDAFNRSESNFTATSGQTSFAPSGGYTNGDDLDVFVNGVRLTPADYTATNGTNVVLDVGANTGDIVDIIYYEAAGPAGAQGAAGAAGIAGTITFSTSAPSNPIMGDLWYDTDDGAFAGYYDDGNTSQWIDLSGGPRGAQGAQGAAGSIPSNISAVNGTFSGNVSIGGTLTYEDVTNIDSVGVVTARAGVKIPDNQKVILGDGSDLQIYHDGANSHISDQGTGDLRLSGNIVKFNNQSNTATMVKATQGGSVELNYNNSLKLSTAAGGVNVAGNLNLNSADNYEIRLGANNDLKLYHDGSNSRIKNVTGQLWLQSDNGIRFTDSGVNESMAAFYDNGAVELYYDGSKKFETTSYGANITGDLRISDNSARLHLYDMNAADNTACTGGFEVFDQNGNRGVFMGATESASNLHFGIRNDEKMRINYNGNIGIGENSPYYKLHLKTNSNATSLSGGTGGNWGGDGIRIENENATGGSMVLAHFRNYDADWHIGGKYVGANDSDFLFLSESNERLRITSDGKIGVGVAAPAQMMEIVNTSGTGSQIQFRDTSTAQGNNNGARFGYNGSGAQIWNFENTYIRFATNNVERLRIQPSGYVGIGENAPGGKLTVKHANTSTSGLNATLKLKQGVATNGNRSSLIFSSLDDYDVAAVNGVVEVHSGTSANNVGRLEFWTKASGSNAAERLRIESSGRVVIHGNGTIRTSWPGAVCSIHNLAMMDAGSGFSWGLRSNSGDTQWCLERIVGTNSFSDSNIKFRVYNNGNYQFAGSNSSDRDIKENIEDISGTSLNLIDQLRPRTFNFKESEGYSTEPKTGFVAQEIHAVIPSIVNGTDGQKDMGVDYNGLVAHLVKAVQELKAENDTLRTRLDAAGL